MRDFKICDDWNVPVKRNLETIGSFNIKGSEMLFNIHNKRHRKIVQYNIIRD